MRCKVVSKSENDTFSLGRRIGEVLLGGEILALSGELGSGKTYFTKGIAGGLGIDRDVVVSPTFTIVNEYEGRLKMYHSDFYRIDSCAEFETIGLDESFKEFKAVIVIEWADKLEQLLPDEKLNVSITVQNKNKRIFEFSTKSKKYNHIFNLLKKV
ncbi:MAG: tRNA (adenosine(37)-N6)-threonylcarbamoyltransferase complex ATPase subunit type 1 TsaE [Candidatus Schekmanbacteria bacterium]|nr:MAG: tRNA (adenosine(37)-N6)-threonylcarbamoyltransferase complex ATPase subunit type 1 TsaE [Candidatus Schekmanbacteria bacterium]